MALSKEDQIRNLIFRYGQRKGQMRQLAWGNHWMKQMKDRIWESQERNQSDVDIIREELEALGVDVSKIRTD